MSLCCEGAPATSRTADAPGLGGRKDKKNIPKFSVLMNIYHYNKHL